MPAVKTVERKRSRRPVWPALLVSTNYQILGCAILQAINWAKENNRRCSRSVADFRKYLQFLGICLHDLIYPTDYFKDLVVSLHFYYFKMTLSFLFLTPHSSFILTIYVFFTSYMMSNLSLQPIYYFSTQ